MKIFTTTSALETQKLAEKIAPLLKGGEILGFIGELGAGKTCFIQGLARGLHVPREYYVSSPSFTILKIYPGDIDLYHFDFYRLSEPREFEDLSFEDYLKGGSIVVIEWADRFLDLLPKNMIKINFEVIGDNERKLTIPEELAGRIIIKSKAQNPSSKSKTNPKSKIQSSEF